MLRGVSPQRVRVLLRLVDRGEFFIRSKLHFSASVAWNKRLLHSSQEGTRCTQQLTPSVVTNKRLLHSTSEVSDKHLSQHDISSLDEQRVPYIASTTTLPQSGPITSLDSSLDYLLKCCFSSPLGDHSCEMVLYDLLTTKLPPLLFRIGEEKLDLRLLQIQKLATLTRWWVLLLEQQRREKSVMESARDTSQPYVSLTQIQQCFHSLYSLQSNDVNVRLLLTSLTYLLQIFPKGSDDESPAVLCSLIYPLHNMSSNYHEVRDLAHVLAIRLHSVRDMDVEGNEIDIGRLMFSLKSMSNGYRKINSLMLSLSHVIRQVSWDPHIHIDGQVVGNALFGLQKMNFPAPFGTIRKRRKPKDFISKGDPFPVILSNQIGQSTFETMKLQTSKLLEGISLAALHIPREVKSRQVRDDMVMFGRIKRRKITGLYDLNELLVAFETLLSRAEGSYSLSANDLGKVCCGMQRLNSEQPVVRSLLKTLTKGIMPTLMLDHETPVVHCSSFDVTRMFFGFKSLNQQQSEARRFLFAVASFIDQHCEDRFNPREISSMMHNLSNFNSYTDEVRYLLNVLHKKIAAHDHRGGRDRMPPQSGAPTSACKDESDDLSLFSAQQISDAFYGICNMSSEQREVRNILDVLSFELFKCPDPLSSKNIATCLHSLHLKSSDHVEVRRLLGALLIKVDAFEGKVK